jgi:hypothetical protein
MAIETLTILANRMTPGPFAAELRVNALALRTRRVGMVNLCRVHLDRMPRPYFRHAIPPAPRSSSVSRQNGRWQRIANRRRSELHPWFERRFRRSRQGAGYQCSAALAFRDGKRGSDRASPLVHDGKAHSASGRNAADTAAVICDSQPNSPPHGPHANADDRRLAMFDSVCRRFLRDPVDSCFDARGDIESDRKCRRPSSILC